LVNLCVGHSFANPGDRRALPGLVRRLNPDFSSIDIRQPSRLRNLLRVQGPVLNAKSQQADSRQSGQGKFVHPVKGCVRAMRKSNSHKRKSNSRVYDDSLPFPLTVGFCNQSAVSKESSTAFELFLVHPQHTVPRTPSTCPSLPKPFTSRHSLSEARSETKRHFRNFLRFIRRAFTPLRAVCWRPMPLIARTIFCRKSGSQSFA